MGLYSDGFDPRRGTSIAEEMRGAVSAWFDGHVQIIDPQHETRTTYDPVTDTGGETTPEVVWDSGERGALVQPVRTTTIGDFGSQQTALIAVRIQAAIPDEIEMRSGLQVKVLDGGNDAEVTRHLFEVSSGIDSSLRWVTRLYCTVMAG
jgi:hypothetical protein